MSSHKGSGANAAFWWPWVAGLVFWGAVLWLAGRYDLRVSLALAGRLGALGAVVARFGEWPGWLAVIAALALLLLDRRARRRADRRWQALLPPARAVILLALLQPLLITQALKLLWGRVRFAHLARDLSDYTPFWLPAGVGAGVSFPSGHVAMAMVPAPLPFFLWRRGRRAGALVAALAVLLVGGTVALGRIVAARHYLSDTVFSLGLALLLGPLLLRLRWVARAGERGTNGGTARSAL